MLLRSLGLASETRPGITRPPGLGCRGPASRPCWPSRCPSPPLPARRVATSERLSLKGSHYTRCVSRWGCGSLPIDGRVSVAAPAMTHPTRPAKVGVSVHHPRSGYTKESLSHLHGSSEKASMVSSSTRPQQYVRETVCPARRAVCCTCTDGRCPQTHQGARRSRPGSVTGYPAFIWSGTPDATHAPSPAPWRRGRVSRQGRHDRPARYLRAAARTDAQGKPGPGSV